MIPIRAAIETQVRIATLKQALTPTLNLEMEPWLSDRNELSR